MYIKPVSSCVGYILLGMACLIGRTLYAASSDETLPFSVASGVWTGMREAFLIKPPEEIIAQVDCQLKKQKITAYERGELYAQRALAEGFKQDWLRAESDADKAIQWAPDNIRGYIAAAFVQHLQGRYRPAITYLNRAMEFVPDEWGVLFLRATLYMQMNRLDEALQDMNAVIKLNHSDPLCFYVRGCIQTVSGDHRSANNDFITAETLDASYKSNVERFLNSYENGSQMAGSTAESNRREYVARQLVEMGKVQEENGRMVDAGNTYRRALYIAPDCGEALKAATDLAMAGSQWTYAAELLNKQLNLRPEDRPVAVNLVKAYANSGQLREAEDLVIRQLMKYRDDVELYVLLGKIEYGLNKYAQAERAYMKALEYEPKNKDAQEGLSRVRVATGQ